MTILKTLGASLLLILCTSCINAQWGTVRGNGDVTTESRSVGEFDIISVGGPYHVLLVPGTEGQIEITTDSNLLEKIVTEVDGDKLKIRTEKNTNIKTSSGAIRVKVFYRDIEGAAMAGSGKIRATEPIKSEEFSVKIAGSGDIELELYNQITEAVVTGSGDAKLSGKANRFEGKVTGSGDIMASELEATVAEGKITGSGDIKMYGTESISGHIVGSGDIRYRGNVDKVNTKVVGSGSVRRL